MSLSLQEQVNTTKKKHILNAAASVFAAKGFHASSIKDVARAAGVADGTIYNYFQNKEALLLGIFSQMSSLAQEAVNPAQLLMLDLRGFVRVMLAQPLQALQGNSSQLLRVVLSEALVNRELAAAFRAQVLEPMLAGAAQFMQAWFEARGQAGPNPELTVKLLSSVILGLLVQAALGNETPENWESLPDELADLLVRGLA